MDNQQADGWMDPVNSTLFPELVPPQNAAEEEINELSTNFVRTTREEEMAWVIRDFLQFKRKYAGPLMVQSVKAMVDGMSVEGVHEAVLDTFFINQRMLDKHGSYTNISAHFEALAKQPVKKAVPEVPKHQEG